MVSSDYYSSRICYLLLVPINILILDSVDKPSKPQGPIIIKNIQLDRITIEWKPPSDTGGLDIMHYIIEICEPSKKVWMKIADVDPDTTSFCIEKLQQDTEYIFRVIARNDVGSSESLESEPVRITSSLGKLY